MTRIDRRWIVLLGCFMATLCLGGTQWSFGVLFKSIQAEFLSSRAVVSSVYTALILAYSVSAIVAGRMSDRHSPRPVLLASACLLVTGLILASQGQTVAALRWSFLLAGLGGGAALSVPLSVVQRWFSHGRWEGFALAVVMSGVGIGAAVFAPLLGHFVGSEGWRFAVAFAGVLFGALTAVSGVLIHAGAPAEVSGAEETDSNAPSPADGKISRVLVSWPFAVLAFATIAALFAFQVIAVHFVPYSVDLDISATTAAMALGMIGGASVPGRLLAGGLHARFGWQRTLTFAMALTGGALLLLVRVNSAEMLYVFVAVYGLAHGMRAVALVGTLRQRFGTGSLGQLIGTTVAFAQLAGAIAPYVAGAVFDHTSSYVTLLVPLAASLFLGALLVNVRTR